MQFLYCQLYLVTSMKWVVKLLCTYVIELSFCQDLHSFFYKKNQHGYLTVCYHFVESLYVWKKAIQSNAQQRIRFGILREPWICSDTISYLDNRKVYYASMHFMCINCTIHFYVTWHNNYIYELLQNSFHFTAIPLAYQIILFPHANIEPSYIGKCRMHNTIFTYVHFILCLTIL